jgi:hypothetical protein
MQDLFAENRLAILSNPWLFVEGPLQNVEGVIHIKAKKIRPLEYDPSRRLRMIFANVPARDSLVTQAGS